MDEQPVKLKAKKRTAADDGQKPAHLITVGSLTASIYLRQAPSGYGYYAYNVKRSYRSLTSGNQIQSTDFFAENRSDLVSVVSEASQWIANASTQAKQALQDAA